jgi:hypothetical protein
VPNRHIMKKILLLLVVLLSVKSLVFAQQQPPKYSKKILFIPLDDRPPCLQFTEKMGLIGDAEVVSPPLELLGRFTTPGQTEKLTEWVKGQDLKSYDAAIVALDMVAYGGLVASRIHKMEADQALKNLEVMKTIRKRAPKLKIYAQNVIMRLAPTPDGKNEAYRAKLADWAELSVAPDAESIAKTKKLETEITAAVLADYKQARQRNLKINLQAIKLVKKKVINYLILSQDDALPHGIHVADREHLVATIKKQGLTDRVAVQPGADEVSMLLLARALSNEYSYSPKIKAVYSSEKIRTTTMPFEDKALHQTVSYHIKATGAREVTDEAEADILFYVFASRKDAGRAVTFAEEIEQKIKADKRVIVADIDPIGDVQGGDETFSEELIKRNIFPALNGYASWNTAGNTIGTALPHGVVFGLAETKLLSNQQLAPRIWKAQNWFTLHRVLDDYFYHNVIREKANDFADQRKRSANQLTPEKRRQVEAYCLELLKEAAGKLTKSYFAPTSGLQRNVRCGDLSNLHFDLPWNRTFEADITFDISCSQPSH